MSNEDKQAILVNKIAVLWDVINQYQTELLPGTRQNLKRITSNASKQTNLLVKTFDSIISEKNAIHFGDDADYIRDKIDELFKH